MKSISNALSHAVSHAASRAVSHAVSHAVSRQVSPKSSNIEPEFSEGAIQEYEKGMREAGLEIKDIESANVTKTYSGSVSYKDLHHSCKSLD